jgi:hypothetical protein
MVVTVVVLALVAVATTSEISCLVAAVAFSVTNLGEALAFLAVLTCPGVVVQGVPLMVVVSLQFHDLFLSVFLIYLFRDLVQDPYDVKPLQAQRLSFHKMADLRFR